MLCREKKYAKCAVPGCTDKTSPRRSVPQKPLELFYEWVRRIGNPKMVGLPPEAVRTKFLICNRHFDSKCQFYPDSKRLFPGSMPTLYLPNSDPNLPCIFKSNSAGQGEKDDSSDNRDLSNNPSQEFTTFVIEQQEEDYDSSQSITEHLVAAENAMEAGGGSSKTANFSACDNGAGDKNNDVMDDGEVEPLYLSSFLEQDVNEGRLLSRVVPLAGNVKSHSGYFTVNREHDSHMFFWFFPHSVDTALVVWINGPCEPGCNGIFKQSGPYMYDGKDITLQPFAWNKLYNMLYIDAPVGFGYSFTNGQAGRPTDAETVGADLYSTLSQFFEMFSEYRECSLYVTGMGMGAKLAIALGHRLVMYRDQYFKGLVLGNPLLDVEIQTDHKAYLTALGVLDSVSAHHCERKQAELKTALKEQNEANFMNAFIEYYLSADSVLHDVTGLDSTFSFVQDLNADERHWLELVNSPEMKFALHVGSEAVWDDGDKAFHTMPRLYMESSLPRLSIILENVKVLLINGQEDLRFPYPMMMNCARSIEWSQKLTFAGTKRFRMQRETAGKVEGFSTRCETLTAVMIRKASHFVFSDRPDFTLQVFANFVKDQPPMLQRVASKQWDMLNPV